MLAAAQIHLGDLPTWLAGLGTVGTLGAALWQIGTERKHRLENEAQEREERHQAQARLIAAVVGPEEPSDKAPILGRTGVDLINGSAEPVYRLVVAIVNIQGTSSATIESWLEILKGRDHESDVTKWPAAPITTVSILPSGIYRVWIHGTGWGRVLSGRRGVEVAFTDRAGSHWIRRATGKLENSPKTRSPTTSGQARTTCRYQNESPELYGSVAITGNARIRWSPYGIPQY